MNSILIVAGENSGEKYGADLIQAYRLLDPKASFFGIGGPEMAASGAELILSIDDLNIIGITEAILSYPRLRRMLRLLQKETLKRQAQAAVLIDSPDFNLRLAPLLHQEGVAILYYISPTVWAWRRGRLKLIRRYVNKMLLIFPFEKEIYASSGIQAAYVGHPLLDRIKIKISPEEFRLKYGLPLDQPLIALLPGSRPTEIRHHGPILSKSISLIRNKLKANFILLQAETIKRELIEKFFSYESKITILDKDKYEAMASSDLILAACGTANMEACLIGTPFLAFYKISPLTYHLGKRLVKIKQYSIVNILAGKPVIPELIQSQFKPENLAQEALDLLTSPEKKEAQRQEFRRIRQLLGEERAALRAAQELFVLIKNVPKKINH